MSKRTTRRDFLKHSAAVGAGFWALGGLEVQAKPAGPNDRVNVAVIGCGGQGGHDLGQVAGTNLANIVALCDVDMGRAAGSFNAHPNARRYVDFRVLLEQERNNIDAVVVSTPDHNHALASILAMRLGKHCYTQKPLTHDVWEARQMKLVATQNNVKTQMGNQGTANNNLRTAVEIVRSGALGTIHEVHVWTNRPIWPQNIAQRPSPAPVPAGLSWDRWIGTAPFRPYARWTDNQNHQHSYAPFDWRGWWDFGTGAIGDMACHTMNLPFMALNMAPPTAVSAVTTTPVNIETGPEGCVVTYEFPASNNQPAYTMKWYERGLPPAALFQGRPQSGSGCLILGAEVNPGGPRKTLYSPSDYGGEYQLLPMNTFAGYQPPAPTLPRAPGQNNYREWLDAIRGGPNTMSNFDYASRLTEVALLGNVAIRAGQRFTWNASTLTASVPQAQQFIRRDYRAGWEIT
jgi:predicted dehydrogenase